MKKQLPGKFQHLFAFGLTLDLGRVSEQPPLFQGSGFLYRPQNNNSKHNRVRVPRNKSLMQVKATCSSWKVFKSLVTESHLMLILIS